MHVVYGMTRPSSHPSAPFKSKFHGHVRDGIDRPCSSPGCANAGSFKAPRSRAPERDGYIYFCLEHIRAFNAAYDYFKGLSREQIENEQRNSGHTSWLKASWSYAGKWRDVSLNPFGSDLHGFDLQDPLSLLDGMPRKAKAAAVPPKIEVALQVLGLTASQLHDREAVRHAYKTLVRRYHPDTNGGDRRHEAVLRKIIDAYTQLNTFLATVARTR